MQKGLPKGIGDERNDRRFCRDEKSRAEDGGGQSEDEPAAENPDEDGAEGGKETPSGGLPLRREGFADDEGQDQAGSGPETPVREGQGDLEKGGWRRR